MTDSHHNRADTFSNHSVRVWSQEGESPSLPHPEKVRLRRCTAQPFQPRIRRQSCASTLLTVICTNPTATLLYYPHPHPPPFASHLRTRTRFHLGKLCRQKTALIADVACGGARCESRPCPRDKARLRLNTLSLPRLFPEQRRACRCVSFRISRGGLVKRGGGGSSRLIVRKLELVCACCRRKCLPVVFFSMVSADGWLRGGRLWIAGHVTEKSKGMYLKVSSRLATGSAHRLTQASSPHLRKAAQQSPVMMQGFIMSRPPLRLFVRAVNPQPRLV